MDLKELGSRLKAERERQGLTVEHMMELTKLSRVNVHAIEDGNKKDFPHPVYAKGFIKNYAKALGLDSEEIGDEFSKFYSVDGSTDKNIQDPSIDENLARSDYSDVSTKTSMSSIFLILILIAVLAGLVYYLHDNALLDFWNNNKTEIVVTEEIVENVAVDEQNDELSIETPVEDSLETVQEEAPIADSIENIVVISEPEESASTSEQKEIPVAAIQPIVTNTVVITAKSGEACWLEAVTDGKNQEFVLQETESISLPYKESLKIKFGNAGGVEVVSDGKPLVLDVAKGKVKTIEFPISE
ncbi:RodZ domain-containing protein [Maridesulfovibrio ferrireducens]|uniref:helix-turn-helix domain-containing protein n=1 Tax=Maridesulfovibrio ferrireducens TaxID=246191 RepID=UPI001A187BB5|nr:RodZ domain-containing protein [Maridesulfovibrio ferrireducens]MBI9111415.1 helix-turn-helix domain-containing protein [Maridesulfovibrio ferrireducens]